MSVKVYTVSLENPKHEKRMFNSSNPKLHEPCFIKADVVLKSDYDKLEARCKELENKLADSNKDDFDDTKKLYALEAENRILKAKLDKALEIIDWSKNWLQNVTLEKKLRTYTPEEHVNYLMKELDSIE